MLAMSVQKIVDPENRPVCHPIAGRFLTTTSLSLGKRNVPDCEKNGGVSSPYGQLETTPSCPSARVSLPQAKNTGTIHFTRRATTPEGHRGERGRCPSRPRATGPPAGTDRQAGNFRVGPSLLFFFKVGNYQFRNTRNGCRLCLVFAVHR